MIKYREDMNCHYIDMHYRYKAWFYVHGVMRHYIDSVNVFCVVYYEDGFNGEKFFTVEFNVRYYEDFQDIEDFIKEHIKQKVDTILERQG